MHLQLNSFVQAFFFFLPTVFYAKQAPQILNQQADNNMNNSSTVLQVWVKALRVNHKSTWRKTNKLLRERDGESCEAQAAPGNITFLSHRRFTQFDEGCSPIMCYWRKRPRLQRWWRESLGRPQKRLAKGSAGPLKRVWSSYKMRLTWSQNFLLDAIFFRKVSQSGWGCDVKSSPTSIIWNHLHHTWIIRFFSILFKELTLFIYTWFLYELSVGSISSRSVSPSLPPSLAELLKFAWRAAASKGGLSSFPSKPRSTFFVMVNTKQTNCRALGQIDKRVWLVFEKLLRK